MKVTLNKTYQTNPIFKGLPTRLKNPEVYPQVLKQLAEVMKTTHKHQAFKTFFNCTECNNNHQKRLTLIKTLGFKDIGQYLQWTKVMDLMGKIK